MKTVGLALGLALVGSSVEAAPLVGPWRVSDPTEVLVLGTPHLSGIESLRPEWLTPLLDRLAAWKPQVIAIESLSGPECFLLRRYDQSWPGTANDYCSRTEKLSALVKASLGLDMPAAEAAAEAGVAALGSNPAPAARRHLAALFAGAGNLGSASVQWLQLPKSERKAGEGVSAELASELDQMIERKNENYLIAAALAARLGLDRVYPTDDHLSDRLQSEAPPGQEQAMQAIWSGERPPLVRKAQAMGKVLHDGASLLNYYRFMNRADVGAAFVRSDMGRAFAEPSPEHFGRRYVAWWETRNLHMVANIRAALGHQPGKRALIIVGNTHKPYFDSYLGMTHEVRLAPVAQVLGN